MCYLSLNILTLPITVSILHLESSVNQGNSNIFDIFLQPKSQNRRLPHLVKESPFHKHGSMRLERHTGPPWSCQTSFENTAKTCFSSKRAPTKDSGKFLEKTPNYTSNILY